jgi:hypothetical protein
MIVNNSQTTDAAISVTFPGQDVRVYSWDWNNKEREGWAFATTGATRDEKGYGVRHWLAPGQEAVYRVESAQLVKESVTLE